MKVETIAVSVWMALMLFGIFVAMDLVSASFGYDSIWFDHINERGKSVGSIAYVKTASGKKFIESLGELKDEGFNDSALLVLDDDMVQMVAAWPKVTRTYTTDPIVDPDFHECWGNVGFVMSQWAALANVSEATCWDLWRTLIAHGLIYPDGDTPDKVKEYMITRVNILMGHDEHR